jgi:hypothetical protein
LIITDGVPDFRQNDFDFRLARRRHNAASSHRAGAAVLRLPGRVRRHFLNRGDIKEQNIQARETIVCGEPVIVFSADGWRWYSDKAEIERDQKQREQQMKPTRFLRKDVTLGNL